MKSKSKLGQSKGGAETKKNKNREREKKKDREDKGQRGTGGGTCAHKREGESRAARR